MMKLNRFIFWLLTALPTIAYGGMLQDSDRQELLKQNLLKNGGFENGKGSSGHLWTASGGTFAIASSGSNLLTGKGSATWDSNSASQTLSYSAITVPNGLKGMNGLFQCKIMTPSGSATHTIQVYDGTNVLASTTITSSTNPVVSGVNFVFPTSGSVTARIVSVASNEPSITIDDCYLGDAANVTNISQAKYLGSVTTPGTASCSWGTITAATMTSFSADSDCPTATATGATVSAPATKIPAIKLTQGGPGTYYFVAYGNLLITGGNQMVRGFQFHDGTTGFASTWLQGGATSQGLGNLLGSITYTSAFTSKQIEIQAQATSTDSASIPNTDSKYPLTIEVYYFPSSSETVLNTSSVAQSWSGYHDTTCSFARTNTVFGDSTADSTCTLTERSNSNFGTVTSYLSGSDKLPGIVFTPTRVGRFFVCASVHLTESGNSEHARVQLTDGTNVISSAAYAPSSGGVSFTQVPLCGIFNATTLSAKTIRVESAGAAGSVTISGFTSGAVVNPIEWSIFAIDQQFPAALLVNSVVNPASGVTQICSAKVANSGTPTVTRSDGSCVSSITDNGTGDSTINFAAGTFSSAPNCTCSGSVTSFPSVCQENKTTTRTSTAYRVETTNGSGTAADVDFDIICIGPK